jgi:hypothetical protein
MQTKRIHLKLQEAIRLLLPDDLLDTLNSLKHVGLINDFKIVDDLLILETERDSDIELAFGITKHENF